ncbi:MAG: phospholipid carrier-dependent glycosyltransferase, partial [Actinobacteria bacterium]|nr:phospholipid carrier-dependent glycosyltransferase [Actinomycetota bacterium]
VLVLAAVLRFWNIGQPHSLVFDETFYVKDGWSLFNRGYETTWPDGADDSFAAGDTNIFNANASYIVHPPLGKWLIGAGMALFGAANSVGWRFAVAIAGLVIVWLVMLIARRLTGSTFIAVLTGGLIAIDGMAIQLSRVTVLDGILAALTLTGVYLVLIDRSHASSRLTALMARNSSQGRSSPWGPVLWWRPWLILAGLAFGLSAGVKWSGIYFLAAFCIYVVVMDALDRRRAGLTFWASSALLRTAPVTFLQTVPIACVAYLSTWLGWITTSGGYNRMWMDDHPDDRWSGLFAWVPNWFQSLAKFHGEMYNFHVGMSTPHPYQANPLTWLFMIRPTSMYYVGRAAGENGCRWDSCSEAISGLPNPLIWWAGTAAVFFLVYYVIRYRKWQPAFILMGMLAGYVPWLMYLNRTVFEFYGIVYEPFMILSIGYVMYLVLGKRSAPDSRRINGIIAIAVFGISAILLSALFYPIWTAMQIPLTYWQMLMWLPSWV